MQNILVIDYQQQSLLVQQLKLLRPRSAIIHVQDYRELLTAVNEIADEDAEVDLIMMNINPDVDANRLDPINLLLLLKLSGKLKNTLFLALFDFPCHCRLTRAAQAAGADKIMAYPAYATHVAKLNRKLMIWDAQRKRRISQPPLDVFYRLNIDPSIPHTI